MREKLEESEPNWPARNRTKHALYYVTRDLTYSSKSYANNFWQFSETNQLWSKKERKNVFPSQEVEDEVYILATKKQFFWGGGVGKDLEATHLTPLRQIFSM